MTYVLVLLLLSLVVAAGYSIHLLRQIPMQTGILMYQMLTMDLDEEEDQS